MSGEIGAQARTIINGLSARGSTSWAWACEGHTRSAPQTIVLCLCNVEPLASFGRVRREDVRSVFKFAASSGGAQPGRTELTANLIGRLSRPKRLLVRSAKAGTRGELDPTPASIRIVRQRRSPTPFVVGDHADW
jgi:hypothetical protein